MNDWEKLQLTDKIRDILRELHHKYPYAERAGRPFLSAYQLAIELKRRHPSELQKYSLGGKGSEDLFSLPSYIAGQLPKAKDADDIEMAFLHELHLGQVLFSQGIEASTEYLTLFRLR